MSLTKNEQHALLALVGEYEENPRPVSTLIVMAACNARAGHQQDAMLVALSSLKRQELVEMRGDAWWPTWDGRRAAHMIKTGTVPAVPEPEPLAEAPPVRPARRDTLRPCQTTALKPVTRFQPVDDLKTCRPCGVTFRRPDSAPIPHDRCQRCHEEITSTRLTAQREPPAFDEPDSPQEPAADCRTPLSADVATEPTGPGPLAPDLVNRCAAMQMTLLADARRRYREGDAEAAGDLRWLMETGRQLLQAGGL